MIYSTKVFLGNLIVGLSAKCAGGVYSMEWNDGLNCRMERFLKLKLESYHYC